MSAASQRMRPYAPAVLRQWLEEFPEKTWHAVDATIVFVDISGFTQLSERLARSGRIGAEELTDAIDACFAGLLEVAYAGGGSLLKFGGDALLLVFTDTDHLGRACRAAVGMRSALRRVGTMETSAGRVELQMSVGIHRDTAHLFLVGGSHRELILTGPAATRTVAAEASAAAGEIVISGTTAPALPPASVGSPRGSGFLLLQAPDGPDDPISPGLRWTASDLLPTIPLALRDHVMAEQHDAEHRRVAVAFLRFSGVDGLLRTEGPDATAAALDDMIRIVQDAVDAHGVTFLGTDINSDGGKILLAAGAPSSAGNDEEVMLLALEAVQSAVPRLHVKIGVHVGSVFAGDIGPEFRRTSTIMGDAVNLAARVMGRAELGQIVATADILEVSHTVFDFRQLEPFLVKGKTQPVIAAVVGRSLGQRTRRVDDGLPLVGRDRELQVLDEAVAAVQDGAGRVLEITGEAGIGKSRLLQALTERAAPLETRQLTGELHRATRPYGSIRRMLRDQLELSTDANDDQAVSRLLDTIEQQAPHLRPWAPLLAIAMGTELPPTEATASFDPRFVRPRLHEAVLDLLAVLWRGPVLLRIEDAHWLDEASLEVVRAIAAATAHQPWILAIARREPDPDLPDSAPVIRLALKPLSDAATTALTTAATEIDPLPDHHARALITRSGGNPLFLQELVTAVREAGNVDSLPDSVGSLVIARIDRLPPAQRSVLREVSVLGYSFPRDLAAAVLTSGDPNEIDHLDDFLGEEAGTVRFRHAMLRDVAYESLPYRRRRRRLHAAAGDTIAASSSEAHELLSMHFHLAGRYRESWHASRTAGDNAAAIYANVDAARFYERAREAATRLGDVATVDVACSSEALGDTLQRLGDAARAGAAHHDAASVLRDDAVSWARVQIKQAQVNAHLKRYSQALATITRALKRLDGDDRPAARAQRAQLSVWYGHFRLDQGRHADAIRWSRAAITEAEAAGDREALGHAYRLLAGKLGRGPPALRPRQRARRADRRRAGGGPRPQQSRRDPVGPGTLGGSGTSLSGHRPDRPGSQFPQCHRLRPQQSGAGRGQARPS